MSDEAKTPPHGAIENGRVFLHRLTDHYDFHCEGGPLENCAEFQEAVRCFEHMAEWISEAAAQADHDSRIRSALVDALDPAAISREAREAALIEAYNTLFVVPAASIEQEQAIQMCQSAILALIDQEPSDRETPPMITYDDGTEIHLATVAGGAAPGGEWSTLTLMRKRPGQPTEMRSYTADGDWSSENFPQCEEPSDREDAS